MRRCTTATNHVRELAGDLVETRPRAMNLMRDDRSPGANFARPRSFSPRHSPPSSIATSIATSRINSTIKSLLSFPGKWDGRCGTRRLHTLGLNNSGGQRRRARMCDLRDGGCLRESQLMCGISELICFPYLAEGVTNKRASTKCDVGIIVVVVVVARARVSAG